MGNQYPSASSDDHDGIIPVADSFTDPDRALPKLSLNGTWLSYLAPAANETKNFQAFVQPLNLFRSPSGEGIRQMTHHPTHDIPTYTWTLDPSTMVFLQDKNGDEEYHMYAVDVESGEIKGLTPFDDTSSAANFAQPVLVGSPALHTYHKL